MEEMIITHIPYTVCDDLGTFPFEKTVRSTSWPSWSQLFPLGFVGFLCFNTARSLGISSNAFGNAWPKWAAMNMGYNRGNCNSPAHRLPFQVTSHPIFASSNTQTSKSLSMSKSFSKSCTPGPPETRVQRWVRSQGCLHQSGQPQGHGLITYNFHLIKNWLGIIIPIYFPIYWG